MSVLVFLPSGAAYVLAEWTWATALQYKYILFYSGLVSPSFSLLLSHVPLSCEKWFGTAEVQSKNPPLEGDEVSVSDRRGCQLWKHGSSSQLEWNSFAFGNHSSLMMFASYDDDQVSVKKAVKYMILLFKCT